MLQKSTLLWVWYYCGKKTNHGFQLIPGYLRLSKFSVLDSWVHILNIVSTIDLGIIFWIHFFGDRKYRSPLYHDYGSLCIHTSHAFMYVLNDSLLHVLLQFLFCFSWKPFPVWPTQCMWDTVARVRGPADMNNEHMVWLEWKHREVATLYHAIWGLEKNTCLAELKCRFQISYCTRILILWIVVRKNYGYFSSKSAFSIGILWRPFNRKVWDWASNDLWMKSKGHWAW